MNLLLNYEIEKKINLKKDIKNDISKQNYEFK
jgi:hypothetical protein